MGSLVVVGFVGFNCEFMTIFGDSGQIPDGATIAVVIIVSGDSHVVVIIRVWSILGLCAGIVLDHRHTKISKLSLPMSNQCINTGMTRWSVVE
jgi:hypothetical protein